MNQEQVDDGPRRPARGVGPRFFVVQRRVLNANRPGSKELPARTGKSAGTRYWVRTAAHGALRPT